MSHVNDPIRTDIDGRPFWRFDDGTLLPVIAGGAGDDDDDDDDDDDGDEDDDDDDDDDDADDKDKDEWTPPTKEEWEAQQERLKKTRREAAARRKRIKELESSDEDDEKTNKVREEAVAPWRKHLVKTEARAALLAEGAAKKGLDSLIRLVDFDELTIEEIDGEFEVEGLDEQVEAIKGDFPERFDPKKRSKGNLDAGGSGKKPVNKTESKSLGQRMVEASR